MTRHTAVPPCTSDDEHAARLRLARSENVGSITFADLLRRFGSAKTALQRLPELAERGGLRRKIRICDAATVDAELQAGRAAGAVCLVRGQGEYPAMLETLDDAPAVMWIRGRADLLQRPSVAFVGTRNASAAGLRTAQLLAGAAGGKGYVTVSGLARGIDAAVHRATLASGTIAVLAGGIDIVYPPEHADLQLQIAERGLLIAEMPPGTEPQARLFPRRNRIIAGLASLTVVCEAALRSGSLITAGYALDYGRDVAAVPGAPLDPRAEGPNRLIQQGAALVHDAADLLRLLEPLREVRERRDLFTAAAPSPELPPAEAAVAAARTAVTALLGPVPIDLDSLIRMSGAPAAAVRAALTELALAGRLIRSAEGLALLPETEDMTKEDVR